MKKTLGVLLALLLTVGTIYMTSQKTSDEYEAWKTQFKIDYSQIEDIYRRMIFYTNLQMVKSHNSNPERTYDMAINQFSSLTNEEFASTYLNPRPYDPEWENVDSEFNSLGSEIDWTTKGMVSPVKNQGQCGSCWAFSAIGTLESFALMKGQSGVRLSEQQLVDCSKKYGNHGCNGGFNYQGLAYIKDHGSASQSQYPYTAKTGTTCHIDGGSFKISSVNSAKGCTGIQTAVDSRPIGVSVDANKWSHYSSGIFNTCGTSLDHDVLLVGYSSTYWKIKNSWGSSWGEHGFIRLAPGNTCGICQDKSPWPV